MLTSEIHQHWSTGRLHKVHNQKGFCLIPIMEWKMIFYPNIMPLLGAQQSCLQMFLWSKASYAYFADEKTETSLKGEEGKK